MKRITHEEDGTTAILLAMVLVVLMGFAAIAIDGAAAWALRRQDQSGADTGAIAGALFTADRTKAQAMQDAEDEIIRITYSTLTPDMTAAEWAAEWVACTDPAKPAEFTETLGSDCISFTDNLRKVRVQTPVIPWITTFARVIGFDRIDTSASAEVNAEMAPSGGVLPFGMPGDASETTQICLKTGPNPSGIPPCDGPDTGNFAFLNFTQFGDPPAIPSDCNPDTGTLTESIAFGIDHPLGVWPPSPADPVVLPAPPHEDRVACDDGNFNSRPYQVFTNTGNVAQALDDGFAGDGAGLDGKLGTGPNRIDVRGKNLDDTPLWDLLTPAGQSFCGPIATHDEMVTCLGGYDDSDGELFSDLIIEAPRWGWVPLFHEATLGNGTTSLTIKEFRAVYIQTTFMSCDATSCEVEWDPGEPATHPGPGKTNIKIEAATAIQLPRASLPEIARLSEPGSDTQVDYLLSR